MSTAAPTQAPKAASLEKQMSQDVLGYKTVPGDSLPFIAQMFYGDEGMVRAIRRVNRKALRKGLQPGITLRLKDPVYFPNPDELSKKRKEWNAALPPAGSSKGAISTQNRPVIQGFSVDEADLWKGPRPRTNLAFAPGEKLTFQVKALSVVAGYASLEVGNYVLVGQRPCYPLVAKAKSAFPVSTLYPVDDVQTSYFDAVDFITWKFENDVSEGSYKARNLELYDQVHHRMTRQHNAGIALEQDVAPFTQDIISCFYYFRLLPLEVGRSYPIPTQSGGQNYQLIVQVVGKEKVTVGAGTFDCFRIKPLVESGTVFRNNEDIDIWLTADNRHIPVLIKSGIVIGSVEISLLEATIPQISGMGDQVQAGVSP